MHAVCMIGMFQAVRTSTLEAAVDHLVDFQHHWRQPRPCLIHYCTAHVEAATASAHYADAIVQVAVPIIRLSTLNIKDFSIALFGGPVMIAAASEILGCCDMMHQAMIDTSVSI